MQEPYSIRFVRSGGILGHTIRIEIARDTLPPHEQRELDSLIENIGLFSSQSFTDHNYPDQFQYTITIIDKNGSHPIVYNESAIPDQIRPLIDYLEHNIRVKK
jgi:hypothetical protein